ncbi:SMI1/KNR4 family protein [Paenibacillus sp. alder61]|uniref:SMI1/KNR4 family protein n=1 Tax=Paenibacillus faecis TaxID=862114 RepID=A0A5D0CNE3_9BACL|nr:MULTISPECIES: SMI1/KNR4 family protein [Paenibacillus]MCA1295004.1 SMI1/KNR4 family protein [Paenibacillus sp. alder61]TYA10734.1 SMI1/KNR4 family protein [Paenibacillus faecis]
MGVTWKRVVGQINDAVIGKVEKTYNIAFPKDFKECVFQNNGGHPSPNIFYYKDGGEGVIDHLLSFTSDPNIVVIYEFIRDEIPLGIFPFATDPFGNQICFDFRKNKEKPTIVFYDHEEVDEYSIIEICDSFSELLDSLH